MGQLHTRFAIGPPLKGSTAAFCEYQFDIILEAGPPSVHVIFMLVHLNLHCWGNMPIRYVHVRQRADLHLLTRSLQSPLSFLSQGSSAQLGLSRLGLGHLALQKEGGSACFQKAAPDPSISQLQTDYCTSNGATANWKRSGTPTHT